MDRLFRIGDFGFRILSELSCAAPAHFCQFGIETGVQNISTGCGKCRPFRYWTEKKSA